MEQHRDPHRLLERTRWEEAVLTGQHGSSGSVGPAAQQGTAWLKGSAKWSFSRPGIDPDEIDGGHCVALSRPQQLVDLLEQLRRQYAPPQPPSSLGPTP